MLHVIVRGAPRPSGSRSNPCFCQIVNRSMPGGTKCTHLEVGCLRARPLLQELGHTSRVTSHGSHVQRCFALHISQQQSASCLPSHKAYTDTPHTRPGRKAATLIASATQVCTAPRAVMPASSALSYDAHGNQSNLASHPQPGLSQSLILVQELTGINPRHRSNHKD